LNIARREFEVIYRLQKMPQLPRIMDSFQEVPGYPGELYFYSLIDPSAPTLQDIAKDTSISYSHRVIIAMNCLKALNELHNQPDDDFQFVIHRRLNPNNIKIKNRQNPIFTEFTYAKIPDSTVSPYWDESLKDDEFTAPELRSSGSFSANALSDTYSLCKCLSLLFQDEDQAGAMRIIEKGLLEEPSDRLGLMDIYNELDGLVKNFQQPTKTTTPVHLWDEDTIIEFRGNNYKIVNKLGSGGIGTTFKVVQINKNDHSEIGSFVAKVIHNEEDGKKAIEAYNKIRPHINPPNLSLIYEVANQWQEDNFTVLMKWVEGMNLSELIEVLPLYAEEIGEESAEAMVLSWLVKLCEALGRLHNAGFVHGDVTPKNIIVSGGYVMLIDYDSVKEIGAKPEIFTIQYCSKDVQDKAPISPSDDIFALSASFYHAIFGREPFAQPNTKDKTRGFSYEGLSVSEYQRIVDFFQRAVHPDKSQRFKNGQEARDFLLKRNQTQLKTSIPDKALSKNEVLWLKEVSRANSLSSPLVSSLPYLEPGYALAWLSRGPSWLLLSPEPIWCLKHRF
jgi:serine/threonine protein kinase